jgi:hypothetical protein
MVDHTTMESLKNSTVAMKTELINKFT